MKASHTAVALTLLLLVSQPAATQNRTQQSRPSATPLVARTERELREDTLLQLTFAGLMFEAIGAAKLPASKGHAAAAQFYLKQATAPLDRDVRYVLSVEGQFHEARAKAFSKYEPEVEEQSEASQRLGNAFGAIIGLTPDDMNGIRDSKKRQAGEILNEELERIQKQFEGPVTSGYATLARKYGSVIDEADPAKLRAVAVAPRGQTASEVLSRHYIGRTGDATEPQTYAETEAALKRVEAARTEIKREVTQLEKLRAFCKTQVEEMSQLGVFSSAAMMRDQLLFGAKNVGGAITGFIETDLEQLIRDREQMLEHAEQESANLRAAAARMKGKASPRPAPNANPASRRRRG